MQVAPTVVAPEFERTLAATLLNYEALDRPQRPKTRQCPGTLRALKPYRQRLTRVQESGIYQITRTDFTNAGIDPAGIDPRTIKLHTEVSRPVCALPANQTGHLILVTRSFSAEKHTRTNLPAATTM